MLLAGIYLGYLDSRLKIPGMTRITVYIYWDWYYPMSIEGFVASCW